MLFYLFFYLLIKPALIYGFAYVLYSRLRGSSGKEKLILKTISVFIAAFMFLWFPVWNPTADEFVTQLIISVVCWFFIVGFWVFKFKFKEFLISFFYSILFYVIIELFIGFYNGFVRYFLHIALQTPTIENEGMRGIIIHATGLVLCPILVFLKKLPGTRSTAF